MKSTQKTNVRASSRLPHSCRIAEEGLAGYVLIGLCAMGGGGEAATYANAHMAWRAW